MLLAFLALAPEAGHKPEKDARAGALRRARQCGGGTNLLREARVMESGAVYDPYHHSKLLVHAQVHANIAYTYYKIYKVIVSICKCIRYILIINIPLRYQTFM